MYRISSQLYPSDWMAADLSFLVRWFVIQNASIITWQTSHPDHTFPSALVCSHWVRRIQVGRNTVHAPPITSTTPLANNKTKTGKKPYGYSRNVTAEAPGVTHYMFPWIIRWISDLPHTNAVMYNKSMRSCQNGVGITSPGFTREA